MEKETYYTITVKRTDREQYEENKTFYVDKDGEEYTYNDEGRVKHVEPTGKLKWSEETTNIYEQKVEDIDIKKLIESVN